MIVVVVLVAVYKSNNVLIIGKCSAIFVSFKVSQNLVWYILILNIERVLNQISDHHIIRLSLTDMQLWIVYGISLRDSDHKHLYQSSCLSVSYWVFADLQYRIKICFRSTAYNRLTNVQRFVSLLESSLHSYHESEKEIFKTED